MDDFKELVDRVSWRPMDSAPKDGSAILLFNDCWDMTFGAIQIARWDDGQWRFDSGMNLDYIDEEDEEDFDPTCWMPLPDPPFRDMEDAHTR